MTIAQLASRYAALNAFSSLCLFIEMYHCYGGRIPLKQKREAREIATLLGSNWMQKCYILTYTRCKMSVAIRTISLKLKLIAKHSVLLRPKGGFVREIYMKNLIVVTEKDVF